MCSFVERGGAIVNSVGRTAIEHSSSRSIRCGQAVIHILSGRETQNQTQPDHLLRDPTYFQERGITRKSSP